MALTLHHAPDFASTIVGPAPEELKLPHALAIVDFDDDLGPTPFTSPRV